ncbi:transcription factor [Verticillium dahliae]
MPGSVGTNTNVMLLGTILGKIANFYQKATDVYFYGGNTDGVAVLGSLQSVGTPRTGFGISLGTFALENENARHLELELLMSELRKLQEVHAQFCDTCAELAENPNVSRAIIRYLNRKIGKTLEVLIHRKGAVNQTRLIQHGAGWSRFAVQNRYKASKVSFIAVITIIQRGPNQSYFTSSPKTSGAKPQVYRDNTPLL